jgi:adenylosuccinate lyase
LLDRVAGDERLGLTRERLQELFEAGAARTGAAAEQVDAVAAAAEAWLRKVPAARDVRAGVIL